MGQETWYRCRLDSRVSSGLCQRSRKRPCDPSILLVGPELLPKPHKVPDDRPAQLNASFEPLLPAHIAAWQECRLSIDHHELGVDDADGQEEHALDLQTQTLQLVRPRQAERSTPLRRLVVFARGRLRVGQLLPQAGGGEAYAHANFARLQDCFGGELAKAVTDAVQRVRGCPVASHKEDFGFCGFDGWE